MSVDLSTEEKLARAKKKLAYTTKLYFIQDYHAHNQNKVYNYNLKPYNLQTKKERTYIAKRSERMNKLARKIENMVEVIEGLEQSG